jgi:hypothetical protein
MLPRIRATEKVRPPTTVLRRTNLGGRFRAPLCSRGFLLLNPGSPWTSCGAYSAGAHELTSVSAIGVAWPEGRFSVQASCCSAMTVYGPRSNLPAQVGVRRLFDSPVDSFHSVVDSNVNDRMTLPDRQTGYFGRFEGRV